MTRVTEAVYSKGALKPAEDLGLREEQRVRLIVEVVDERPEDRAAALAKLRHREHAVLLTRATAHSGRVA